ncbi:hypothetical protein QTG54_011763 [Skeletonema marinoi]|uniref:PPIase FKBP-type domain-containing protein n=1 Tax=Skeletonema marinoi TaxID=267567 RepID=A0AAD8Y141_9STRA|nr:hypothetical protein QTG54_011763 [Skeletonema marinoi]
MKAIASVSLIVVAAVVLLGCASALQQPAATNQFPTRRSILSLPPKAVIAAATGASSATITPSTANAAKPNGLILDKSSESGLKWADAKQGTGQPLKPGMVASIDYSMASTVGRQPQIYTTKDKGVPYRWTLGDGSTIAGIELAILGSSGDDNSIPPMLPGGIRRVIIPANLGYQSILNEKDPKCIEGKDIGPIPPKNNSDGGYQRWYQFYCNPRIPYQPDIVLDIKLYGKR